MQVHLVLLKVLRGELIGHLRKLFLLVAWLEQFYWRLELL